MARDFDEFLAAEVDDLAKAAVDREVRAHMGREWKPGVHEGDEAAAAVSRLIGEHDRFPTVAELMADSGLDPEEWAPIRSTPNRYQGFYKDKDAQEHIVTLKQIKVECVRRAPAFRVLLPDLFAIDPDTYVPPAARPERLEGRPKTYLVTTDLQVPFHDEALHQLTLRFAQDVRPDAWYSLGDDLDLPSLSHYRPKLARGPGETEFHAGLNETIQTGARIYWERTTALPEYADRALVPGNHDERADSFQIDHAQALYGVRAAEIGPYESYAALDLYRLMHCQAMGWRVLRSEFGGYPYSEIAICPGLQGIHGTVARGKAARSIEVELEERTCSVIQGHCNKLAQIFRIRGNADGTPHTVTGVEGGMLGSVRGSGGFGKRLVSNWAQGFSVVTDWGGGVWNIELVPYINHAIRFRDQQWQAAPDHTISTGAAA